MTDLCSYLEPDSIVPLIGLEGRMGNDLQTHQVVSPEPAVFIPCDVPDGRLQTGGWTDPIVGVILHAEDFSHLQAGEDLGILLDQHTHGPGCHIPDLELIGHFQTVKRKFNAVEPIKDFPWFRPSVEETCCRGIRIHGNQPLDPCARCICERQWSGSHGARNLVC
jgi:hypothetical protein